MYILNSPFIHVVPPSVLCAILAVVGILSAQSASDSKRAMDQITNDRGVQRALANLGAHAQAITEEQVRITEIPAPPFHESVRGAYLAKLLSQTGLKVQTDEVGNVIGERPGASSDDYVLVVAHLDTVFPADTDVHVQRQGGRIYAPGISDNGTGLSTMVAVARAMQDASLKTRDTILFVADVGEEGEGNLRGIRKLVDAYRGRLRYVIALDGSSSDYVATAALGSHRVEISLTGPGGHSWADFGAANPINAMARGIARFANTSVPQNPRTSFNVGEIEGGTSVNSIPARAVIKVDLRSESQAEITKLENTLRQCIQSGVDEEMAAVRQRGLPNVKDIGIEFKVLGIRPDGVLPQNSTLLAAVVAADDYLGNESREERASTDANLPLSLGIPAIALGAGGRSAGAHSLNEWYDPAGRELGMRRILLTLLQVAGFTGAEDGVGN